MITKRAFLFGGSALCLVAPKLSVKAEAIPLQRKIVCMLGDTPVILSVLWNGPGPRFFHPHENESTSYRAAKSIVMQRGGALVSLHHGGGRYIQFLQGGKKYRCDPNRIYTPEGTKLTLGVAPPEVLASVNAFATTVALQVRKSMSAQSVVIGIHNNTPGAYSIQSYGVGGDMRGDASMVFVNPAQSADDFFLTTEQSLFESLKSRAYNVVLQKNPPQHNDGSFSVFCSQQGMPYVNVEAKDAHGAIQARMLRDLVGILSSAA